MPDSLDPIVRRFGLLYIFTLNISSDMAVFLGVVLLVVLISLIIWMTTRVPNNFPPGPVKIPIIGTTGVLWHDFQVYKVFRMMREVYGEVAGFYIFNSPVIVISGLDAVRESLTREDLADRPKNVVVNCLPEGEEWQGGVWSDQRRFTLHHLRNLGFGKSSLVAIAHEEIHSVLESIEELSGGSEKGYIYPFDIGNILGGVSANILCHLITGQRFHHNSPELQRLSEEMKVVFRLCFETTSLFQIYPTLARMVSAVRGEPPLQTTFNAVATFLKGEISKHKETLDINNPRDFIDCYLCEVEKQKKDGKAQFNETTLLHICTELLSAGIETTWTNLSWAMLYMVVHPNIQRKVQQELDEVLGKDRLPSLDDRAKLPYVDATIHEVLRLASTAPGTIPHAPVTTGEYITFRGYHIPKDSKVLVNLYCLHHDPNIWKCPNDFIPERFLAENRKGIPREALIPFSMGKRVCPGESLARNNMFLIFAAILQRYSLLIPDGHPVPSLEPMGKITLYPKPYKVKVQQRS